MRTDNNEQVAIVLPKDEISSLAAPEQQQINSMCNQQTNSLEQLDRIGFHHSNGQYVNSIPGDAFGEAAIETAMMYVPEVPSSNTESCNSNNIDSSLQSNNQGNGAHCHNNQYQDQQQEIFEDIIANTNPALAALPDAETLAATNLYMNHNATYFNVKRNLLQNNNYGSSNNLLDADYRMISLSEYNYSCQDKIDQEDMDHDFDQSSNFSEELDSKNMLEFMHLRPIGGQEIGGVYRRRRGYSQRQQEIITDEDLSNQNEFSPFNLEYNDCNEAHNRSECCGNNDDEMDISRESTLNFSTKEELFMEPREQSHFASEHMNNKKRNGSKKDFKKQMSRAAVSQFNLNDEDALMYQDCDQIIKDEEDPDKMDDLGMGLQLATRQKSLRVPFHCSDIKRNVNKLDLRNQYEENEKPQESVLLPPLTPGPAQIQKDRKVKKLDLDQFEIDVDMMKKAQNIQIEEEIKQSFQDTPSSLNDSLYKYLVGSGEQFQQGAYRNQYNSQLNWKQEFSYDQNQRYSQDNQKLFVKHGYPLPNKQIQIHQFNANASPAQNLGNSLYNNFEEQITNIDTNRILENRIQITDLKDRKNAEVFFGEKQECHLNPSPSSNMRRKLENIKHENKMNEAPTPKESKLKKVKFQSNLDQNSKIKVDIEEAGVKESSKHIHKQDKFVKQTPLSKIKNIRKSQKLKIKDKVLDLLKETALITEGDVHNSTLGITDQVKPKISFEKNILIQNIAETKAESNTQIVEQDQQIGTTNPIDSTSEKGAQKKKQPKMTKINIANAKAEKYYKQFDFFFNRSCFRIMTEFFKDKFNKFYAERQATLKQVNFQLWQQQMKQGGLTATTKVDMDIIMRDFIQYIFGNQIFNGANYKVSDIEQQQIVNSMIMIVFSHRYSKGDKFIMEAEAETASQDSNQCPIDFTIIRDCMYKYSKKAQDRYFSYPIEAFFFAIFALSDEGLHFLQSKPGNNEAEKLKRLHNDLAVLKNQAVMNLQNQTKLLDMSLSSQPSTSESSQQERIGQDFQSHQSPKLGICLFNELKRLTKGRI